MARFFRKVSEDNLFPSDWKTMPLTPVAWMQTGDLFLTCSAKVHIFRKTSKGRELVAVRDGDKIYHVTQTHQIRSPSNPLIR